MRDVPRSLGGSQSCFVYIYINLNDGPHVRFVQLPFDAIGASV